MTDAKLLLIRENHKILSMLLENGKLIEINAFPDILQENTEQTFTLGNIYIGKVKNVVKNIHSAFVELSPGHTAFLPLDHAAGVLNRPDDGRILAGDELLVQIQKEAVKTKDPVLTTAISLSGRYVVLESSAASKDRKRLLYSGKLSPAQKSYIHDYLDQYENLLQENVFDKFQMIIRTNAAELSDLSVLYEEIISLTDKLKHILKTAGNRTCYSCLYQQDRPWLTEVRDTYSSQYQEIITDDPALYQELHSYLQNYYPAECEKIRLYKDSRVSLKNLYSLTARIKEATDSHIWLRSGGYLVIEPTEALTVIDVNSGKFSGRKATSETWKLINHEAAEEIARQLRLRNYSGIIIVDFINMDTKRDEEELLKFLSSELRKDPVKTTVVDITPLGLVEITRKKIRKSFKEQLDA